MVNMAGMVKEDTSKGTTGTGSTLTAMSVKAEMSELMKDMDDYWKNPTKQHRMRELAEEASKLEESQ